jgi:SAM-dependent methyltransferase
MDYVGTELELFQHATNWKAYFASLIRPFIGAEVGEIGAGLGGSTQFLNDGRANSWCCVEPDSSLSETLKDRVRTGELPGNCQVLQGTLSDVPPARVFDTLVYCDVLEHIEDDQAEVNLAASHLKRDGYLVILCPAHNWLYSPFDKSIGHYRRYNRTMMRALTPKGFECVSCRYLDSVGTVLSALNRFVLRQSMPNKKQIAFWDRRVVPISRRVDSAILHNFGKSVLAVFRSGRSG